MQTRKRNALKGKKFAKFVIISDILVRSKFIWVIADFVLEIKI